VLSLIVQWEIFSERVRSFDRPLRLHSDARLAASAGENDGLLGEGLSQSLGLRRGKRPRSLVASGPERGIVLLTWKTVKDTLRATVRLGWDGKVYKTFLGPRPGERLPMKCGLASP